MSARRALFPIYCPRCGERIVPTPKELREWRKANGFTQSQMAALLNVSPAHVTFLEQGKRSPSAILVERYWKFVSGRERASEMLFSASPKPTELQRRHTARASTESE